LLWAILLGTVLVIFLIEMCGRLAAVSHHTLADAIRERMGFRYFVVPLCAELVVDWLVVAAEIGGVATALEILTGVPFQIWAIPVAFAMWLVLWLGGFGTIENGIAALGAVTVSFAVAAVMLWPGIRTLGRGLIPAGPSAGPHYWYLAVSIVGSLASPYLLNFYAAGAVEEKWKARDLPVNRIVASVGMSFGSVLAMALLIVCAVVLAPAGVKVETYAQMAGAFTAPFGAWGVPLFAASLAVAAFGAGMEVSLNVAYVVSQGFGWNWSENQRPAADARFALVYTLVLVASTILVVIGLDPLMVTNFSMALNALIAPAVVFPLLVLMNDRRYLRQFTNGWFSNTMVIVATAIVFILAAVAIPLQLLGGS
jgi:Mn2+/Fe2+ NRAMP family transporter